MTLSKSKTSSLAVSVSTTSSPNNNNNSSSHSSSNNTTNGMVSNHSSATNNNNHNNNNKQQRSNYQECADCSSPSALWASLNHGVVICDQCCLAHRSLGRAISIIKSLKKSYWPQSQIDVKYPTLNKTLNIT